jgi:DNA excision repair protein ERCC-2
VYTVEGLKNFRPSKQARKDSEAILWEILYPEELHKRCTHTCPYEVMAIGAKSADIIILNYNHVFDDTMRDALFDSGTSTATSSPRTSSIRRLPK